LGNSAASWLGGTIPWVLAGLGIGGSLCPSGPAKSRGEKKTPRAGKKKFRAGKGGAGKKLGTAISPFSGPRDLEKKRERFRPNSGSPRGPADNFTPSTWPGRARTVGPLSAGEKKKNGAGAKGNPTFHFKNDSPAQFAGAEQKGGANHFPASAGRPRPSPGPPVGGRSRGLGRVRAFGFPGGWRGSFHTPLGGGGTVFEKKNKKQCGAGGRRANLTGRATPFRRGTLGPTRRWGGPRAVRPEHPWRRGGARGPGPIGLVSRLFAGALYRKPCGGRADRFAQRRGGAKADPIKFFPLAVWGSPRGSFALLGGKRRPNSRRGILDSQGTKFLAHFMGGV